VHVACIISLVGKTREKTLLGTYGGSWRIILKRTLRIGVGFIQKIQVRSINAVLVRQFYFHCNIQMGI